MNLQYNVHSEIAPLRKVIVHKPDLGISRISPRRAEELLFDDIVHLATMQDEHKVFQGVLEKFVGAENVYETKDLVSESLAASPKGKSKLLDNIIRYEELPNSYRTMLDKMSDDELAEVLITGYVELKDLILFDPIPNFIFTRDIAVMVNEHLIITKAAKEARHRENLLTRFFFYHHPMFKSLHDGNKIINLNHIEEFPPSRKGEPVSAEGGDIMLIHQDFLLIGSSERTNSHAFHSIKDELFKRGAVKNVVQITIPNERSFMHIDTLFTQVSDDHIVAYAPIICDGIGSNVKVYTDTGSVRSYHSVQEFIHKEINPDIVFIPSGNGESPYQEREQWTDGCNLVALRPGIAVAYDRNPFTEIAFMKKGYEIVKAVDVLAMSAEEISSLKNTIITLPSSELSRARGGSHCMTCPIMRG